jgi:hypothetical protein
MFMDDTTLSEVIEVLNFIIYLTIIIYTIYIVVMKVLTHSLN